MVGIGDRLALDGYTPLLVNTGSDPERERASIEAMLARQVDGFIAATARLDVRATGGGDGARPVRRVGEPNLRGRLDLRLHHRRSQGQRAGSPAHRSSWGTSASATSPGLRTSRPDTGAIWVSPRLWRRRACPFCPSGSASRAPSRRWRPRAPAPRYCGPTPGSRRSSRPMTDWRSGATTRWEELGLSCPDDVSIIGFNDMAFIDRLRPPLSSVHVPQREIGYAAADLLLEQLTDDSAPRHASCCSNRR